MRLDVNELILYSYKRHASFVQDHKLLFRGKKNKPVFRGAVPAHEQRYQCLERLHMRAIEVLPGRAD